MQCELNVNKGEKIKNEKQSSKKIINKKVLGKGLCILIGGFLLGRINLLLNQTDTMGIAPFGIAYLMAVIITDTKFNSIASAVGVCIGSLTIGGLVSDNKKYLVAVGFVIAYYMIISLTSKKKKELAGFGIIFISFFAYDLFINEYQIGVSFTLSIIETLIIMPIYYVIKYAIDSIDIYKINKRFSSEEVVSVSILMCLLVAGVGDINIMDYSMRNIFALTLVLGVAYIGGAANGAMIGVAMGIILGVSQNDMIASIGFFSVGGLIVGIFKDTGKIFSLLAGMIIYFALGVYSNDLTAKFIVEVLSANIIFLCIPRKVYKSIMIDSNQKINKQAMIQGEIKAIKEEFTLKVKELTNVLITISKSLDIGDENETLSMKSCSSELVESVADRCCSKCENRVVCWEKNLNQTFNSFQLMIEDAERGKLIVPQELQKKCVKDFTLLKSVDTVMNNYKTNEVIKERISEGRRILAEHVSNMSDTLNELLTNFKKEVSIDYDLQKRVKRQLNKQGIDYNEVFCYINAEGRSKVKIKINSLDNLEYYEKTILTILNKIMRKNLCVSKEECGINEEDGKYTITLQEAPIYKMISYGQKIPKSGEKQTGDSYSFGDSINGMYNVILSDGMGFGPEAQKESKSTIELTEKFLEAGFDENTTINTINSIMGLRFAQDEKYATLDLSKIDLYNGNTTFIKIGAAPTFVKRGKQVKSINSKNLPFGLVDEVDIEFLQGDLKPGDVLVNITDGILDSDNSKNDNYNWLEEYLKQVDLDPKTLSEKIMERAIKLSGGSNKDDMTVVVSKIYLAG